MIALDPTQTVAVPFAGVTFHARFLTARETIKRRALYAKAIEQADDVGLNEAVEILRMQVVGWDVSDRAFSADALPDMLTFIELYGLIAACSQATSLAEADKKKCESPSLAPADNAASDAAAASA